MDPVRMSVDTRRRTPELITNPTLAAVTPDLATYVQMIPTGTFPQAQLGQQTLLPHTLSSDHEKVRG